ncbi:LacI family DNA-binding transcriptional regulator [Bacillus taeanensis]|uniref:HTH lacI-type domain-containing protein n=1 Tax=Bacillus taeanensis TaxID=273032 RepID=A0A366Y333_9BACI|nr:LacI family DNA-binding transcriptional regulator [Bacillus taeanensis]RBW70794.1 hypothetical protein DS031_04790 [Bacillus taeanensis]
MKKEINITEVARKAGVSTATVSRVFNNSGPVKESTRKKIEKIIEETGYRPNILARELADKKTHLIGLIVHDMRGEGIPRSITGVSTVLEENGYNLLIACSNGNINSEIKHFEIFRSKRVEGILFATKEFKKEHRELIKSLPIPVVVMLQDTEKEQISYVTFDNYNFGKESAQKLIDLGHKQFAVVGGPMHSVNSEQRKKGVLDAVSENGIAISPLLIRHGDYSIEEGYIQTNKMLAAGTSFTALIAINDGMAIGAVNCLQDHGIRVPEEVSVLGLDDTVLAKASRLELSGVYYSYSELGKESARLLLKQIQADEFQFDKYIVPYTINLRESVAKRRHV